MSRHTVAVIVATLMLGLAVPAGAQDPGDEGSEACRVAQLAVYDLVANEGPYPNHGQLMKALNAFLNVEIQDGAITGACAACILRQFAQQIPVEEQTACGTDPVSKIVEDFAIDQFESLRALVDPDDTSPPVASVVGSHLEVASDAWVYVLDTTGRQVLRPVAVTPHLESAFAYDISADLDGWAQQRVPAPTISLAKEIALAAFGTEYVFDPATRVVPSRELITSKAIEWEMVRAYEGRTTVLFQPMLPDEPTAESYGAFLEFSAEGEPGVRTVAYQVPSRSYDTAITFAPAGHVMRVESGFTTPEVRDMVGLFQQALIDGSIFRQPVLYDDTMRLATFFNADEPRLELTAYSYEGEPFLDPNHFCWVPALCNPYYPFTPFDYCYNSPYAPDVDLEIRPSREYRYHTFNIWNEYGREGGIRGNWLRDSVAWEIPNATVQVHANLRDYALLEPPARIKEFEMCDEEEYPFWHSVGNKLEQGFFDDLESAQVAMINTHGGPLWSHRIGRETFQFMRNYDEWVTLHEPGDDALGTGLLRHLFLETCSGINWRNNFKGDIKNLVVDWMSPGVADGLRTVGGFDGGRVGGQVTGWRFFGHYHKGESISQAWFNMGLEEFDCNVPIVVAYGNTEQDAAATLFDGRFSHASAGTGWAIAAEPITERYLQPRGCCLNTSVGPTCVELDHADCEAFGGLPLDCGTNCAEHGKQCLPPEEEE
jgi:hypothetical protein